VGESEICSSVHREYEMTDIPASLLVQFEHAAKELANRSTGLSDMAVDEDVRNWLDGEDEPLPWHDRSRVTADEYFFVTTLYGNMNLEGQRTMIRKFFSPLFVEAAKRDIRNFRPDTPGYAGLRSSWMKDRLCTMAAVLRRRGCSMQEYVEELRALEKRAASDNPMPALDRIVENHGATGVKTLSVFVRDCVGGNCFPIDLRVRRQLENYDLPADERLLVRMCLALGQNPRELARIFYQAEAEEMNLVDFIKLDESEPCVFYTWDGKGWLRDPSRKPIRQVNALKFDVFDSDTEDWEPCTMIREEDGLYHWRDPDGPAHWWGFLSETETHGYLTGNYINPDGHQGVQIFVWPKA
jgi:hypothetical protein